MHLETFHHYQRRSRFPASIHSWRIFLDFIKNQKIIAETKPTNKCPNCVGKTFFGFSSLREWLTKSLELKNKPKVYLFIYLFFTFVLHPIRAGSVSPIQPRVQHKGKSSQERKKERKRDPSACSIFHRRPIDFLFLSGGRPRDWEKHIFQKKKNSIHQEKVVKTPQEREMRSLK